MMQPTIDALNERAKVAESAKVVAEQELAALHARLQECPQVLPLDSLVEIEGRRRRLTPEQFEELRSNLALNPLVQPISVKSLGDGKYEVISGYNRIAVYRQLGRHEIPVAVVAISLEEIERSAFFANLLQPSLPDYERYLGFKKWHDKTGDSQKVMAEKAGVSKSVVSKLFSFADLPSPVLELIAESPDAIGVQCVTELVKLVSSGKASRIEEAVRLLVEGKLTQQEAVRFAAFDEKQRKPNQAVKTVKVRAGRLEYCSFVSKGPMLTINFKYEQERLGAEEAIENLLQELAIRAKNSAD